MLSRDEARMLLDKLVEVIHDDDAWEDEPDSVVVIEDD